MDRKKFIKLGGSIATGAGFFPAGVSELMGKTKVESLQQSRSVTLSEERADYTIHIGTGLIEVGPQLIISTTTYNGQFPGPLLRFKEGERTIVDIYNDTDMPEQFHWHGRFVPVDVDGAAEEGTPYIPAQGMRREIFVPKPSGLRFY